MNSKNTASDYRTSHTDVEHAKSYHEEFIRDKHRNMVWGFEKNILYIILTKYFKDVDVKHLDFACGTGRILSHLEGKVAESVGVDLSAAMLDVARANVKRAEIIEADLTKNDVLGNRKFNLITSFRFFPNAQPELRSEVMKVLTGHLSADGYLVFNNHRNSASSVFRLARLLGRGGFEGMSMAEVQALVAEHHLQIVKIHHMCVLPATGKHLLLPQPILRWFEWGFARIPLFRSLGENLIYVCRHDKVKQV